MGFSYHAGCLALTVLLSFLAPIQRRNKLHSVERMTARLNHQNPDRAIGNLTDLNCQHAVVNYDVFCESLVALALDIA
jgi:hypothetical protein